MTILWTEPPTIWSDALPDLAPGDSRKLWLLDHELRITATKETGSHTGRRRYRVECLTCKEEVHDATTGPMSLVRQHTKLWRHETEDTCTYCQSPHAPFAVHVMLMVRNPRLETMIRPACERCYLLLIESGESSIILNKLPWPHDVLTSAAYDASWPAESEGDL